MQFNVSHCDREFLQQYTTTVMVKNLNPRLCFFFGVILSQYKVVANIV